MNIYLHVISEDVSVYLINGIFIEDASCIEYPKNKALYITICPLSAIYLPYTVKIVNGNILFNNDLSYSYMINEQHYIIKMLSRSNYVYSCVQHESTLSVESIPHLFFKSIIEKNVLEARKYMTEELSNSIDDEALLEFFVEYKEMVRDNFLEKDTTTYYLIDHNNIAKKFQFILKNNLIDNITD